MANLSKHFFEDKEKIEPVRINKYLSEAGMCSRRAADQLIEDGKVLIDGVPAVKGSKVLPGQKVTLQGQEKEIEKEEKLVLIAFNKPRGIVCTAERREPDNIIDFLKFDSRIFPIGRLDKDSEGLILLTNDGEIMNKILRAGNQHEREYLVQVNKPVTKEFLQGMAEGVPILNTVTKPCQVENLGRDTFRIVLRQGLNRQIRRMCEHFGYRVLALKRIRIMNINLGRLKTGGYRNLTERELDELKQMLQESMNLPYAEMEKEIEIEEPQASVIFHDTSARKRTGRGLRNPAGEEKKNKEDATGYHAASGKGIECYATSGKGTEYRVSSGKGTEYHTTSRKSAEYHASARNKEKKGYQDLKGGSHGIEYLGRSAYKNGRKKAKDQRTY